MRITAIRRGWSPVVVPALAVVVAVGLVSCSAAERQANDQVGVARSKPAGDELLRQAEERLIKQCMSRHGFEYREQPPPVPVREFPYVVDDIAWARQHGYGHLVDRPDPAATDVNEPILAGLSPDRQEAWHRTLLGAGRQLTVDIAGLGKISAPDNGCAAEARRTLYGDLAGWYRARRTVDHLGIHLRNEVMGDPRYRVGLAAWAVCARGRGYPSSTPRQLREFTLKAAEHAQSGQARTLEVAAAETEAQCAHRAGLPATIRALERIHRPAVEGRWAGQRKALQSFSQEATPRAQQILANS